VNVDDSASGGREQRRSQESRISEEHDIGPVLCNQFDATAIVVISH
jgi:hypothetical protein